MERVIQNKKELAAACMCQLDVAAIAHLGAAGQAQSTVLTISNIHCGSIGLDFFV